jgi:hypothetical protein
VVAQFSARSKLALSVGEKGEEEKKQKKKNKKKNKKNKDFARSKQWLVIIVFYSYSSIRLESTTNGTRPTDNQTSIYLSIQGLKVSRL